MKNNLETDLLKLNIPIGNYYFSDQLEAWPYKGGEDVDINFKIIPKKEAFLILDLWAETTKNHKYVYFLILWNCNKYVIFVNCSYLNNMWRITENGPQNLTYL